MKFKFYERNWSLTFKSPHNWVVLCFLMMISLTSTATAINRCVTTSTCTGSCGACYTTLNAALTAALSGDTIILQMNVSESDTINPSGIGGYSITIEGDPAAAEDTYTWDAAGNANGIFSLGNNISSITIENLILTSTTNTGNPVITANLNDIFLGLIDDFITRTSTVTGNVINFTAVNSNDGVSIVASTITGSVATSNGISLNSGNGHPELYMANSVISGIMNGAGITITDLSNGNPLYVLQNDSIGANEIGISSPNGYGTVTNTAFADTSADLQIEAGEQANYTYDAFYTTALTGFPASDIAITNPAATFIDWAGGNFHEITGSPLIGAGTTIPSITTDKDGNARTVPYDIGAYQFGAVSFTSTPTNTPTFTATPTATPSFTFTIAFTATSTITPTYTGSPTFTFTATNTITLTPTSSATSTSTSTPTQSSTSTYTFTITNTPTITYTPTITATPTATLSTNDIFYVSQNVFYPTTNNPVSIFVEYNKFPGEYDFWIYNTAGEHIKTLDHEQLNAPISQSYFWDGTNKYGNKCASGVYILYLVEPYSQKLKRILLVR